MTLNSRILVVWAVLMLVSTGVVAADSGPGYVSDHHGCLPPSIYVRDYIPYFALHPPVYYSYPVPRPYGYSPYAYPPGTKTPEISVERPLIIENTFVPKRISPVGPKRDRVARTPLRIINPHVVRSGESREPEADKVAVDRSRPPEVVFPQAGAGRP